MRSCERGHKDTPKGSAGEAFRLNGSGEGGARRDMPEAGDRREGAAIDS